VRLYETLFTVEDPSGDGEKVDFRTLINPKSREVLRAKLERSLADAPPETRVQFERQGFFFHDPVDAAAGKVAWNRIVSLKDGWAKVAGKG
jgi:glutaminyl-tRNA synthetase